MSKTLPPALIFDLDGTLADTLGDLTTSLNILLAEIGRPERSRAEVEAFVGDGLGPLLTRATGLGDPTVIADLVKRYRPLYRDRMLATTCLYPGIADMLDALAERGALMCVLSNKPDEFTKPICEALLSRWKFVRCLGAGDGVPRKPDPTGAIMLATEMGRLPGDVAFVGDSPIDVNTAMAAGMTSIGVAWGFRSRDHLVTAGADHIIHEPMQLPPLV